MSEESLERLAELLTRGRERRDPSRLLPEPMLERERERERERRGAYLERLSVRGEKDEDDDDDDN